MTGFMTWSLTAVVHLGSILCPGMIVMPGSLVAEAAFEPVDEVTVTRGITGRILVESEHGFVRGRPDLDLESPILVRVANVRVGPEGEHLSELEFIGTDVGEFDLRNVLVFEDGGPIDRIGPQMIEIVSNLSADAPSDVFLAEAPPASIGGVVSGQLLCGDRASLWLLVPVAVAIQPVAPPAATAPDRRDSAAHRRSIKSRAARPNSGGGLGSSPSPERGRLELLLSRPLAGPPRTRGRIRIDAVRPSFEDRCREAGRLLRRRRILAARAEADARRRAAELAELLAAVPRDP